MPTFSDVIFEREYKDFLQVKDEWLQIVESLAICHSKNSKNESIRPIAFTNDEKVFLKAVDLQFKWQKFAKHASELKKNKDIAIVVSIYSPVPILLIEPKKASISFFNATTTTTHTREDLIARYGKQITKLAKYPHAADAVASLEKEKANFARYPEGHKFRCRTGGYEDTIIDVVYKNQEESERIRCGVHGLLIYHPEWTEHSVSVAREPSKEYMNKYNLIKPVTCSIFPNGELYDLDEIELAQAHSSQKTVVEQTISGRRYHFERRAKTKLARAKTEEETAEIRRGIEASRIQMEQLCQEDLELLSKKMATNNTAVLSMTELREMFGDKRKRRGKTLRLLTSK